MLVFGSLLAPDTPAWLLITSLVVGLIFFLGTFVWATILEIRFKGPYSLASASSRKKWRQSGLIAFLYSINIPVLGLMQPVLSPLPDQWPGFPLFCAGIWVIAFPLAIVWKKLDLEFALWSYQKTSQNMKRWPNLKTMFSRPIFRWQKVLMTSEMRRFYEEGYGETKARKRKTSKVKKTQAKARK